MSLLAIFPLKRVKEDCNKVLVNVDVQLAKFTLLVRLDLEEQLWVGLLVSHHSQIKREFFYDWLQLACNRVEVLALEDDICTDEHLHMGLL